MKTYPVLKHHALWGSEDITASILNLSARWK